MRLLSLAQARSCRDDGAVRSSAGAEPGRRAQKGLFVIVKSRFIHCVAVVLAGAACSSDPSGGQTGSGGNNGTGASGGSAATGGFAPGGTGGVGAGTGTGGAATGGTGAGSGGTPPVGTGGFPSGGTGGVPGVGGTPGVGGSMPGTGGDPAGGAGGTGGTPPGSGGTGGSNPAAITAAQAAAAMGKGVNIGNTFDHAQQPPNFAKVSTKLDAYYAKGFRNVRIPITWTEALDGSALADPNVGAVDRQHPRLAVIEQVVDYALSKPDLYVVINAHHEQALKTQNRAAVLERLWQDLVDIFGDRDPRLLFEILNEPHKSDDSSSPMDPADLRNMTQKAYDKIRAVNPTRIVIIGGNQWFHASEMATVWPNLDQVGGGNDPYLMATFHHYDPWTFCGDNQGDYADNWTDANVSGPMDTMRNWAASVGNNMPIYIGEWGVGWGSRYDQMDCNNIRHWYQKLGNEIAPSKGMPTAVWDDGGWFKMFDQSSDTFTNNLVDCITGDCAWNGTDRFNQGCL